MRAGIPINCLLSEPVLKKYKYIAFGTAAALVYWAVDSTVDYHLSAAGEFELFPSDFTELWMRLVIFLQFIVLGVVVQRHVWQLAEANDRMLVEAAHRHASELEAQRASASLLREHEKAEIYRSTVRAAHHILNNLLNQLQLFKIEAESSQDFDQDVLKLYDAVTSEASRLVKQLSDVENVTGQDIESSVQPKQ